MVFYPPPPSSLSQEPRTVINKNEKRIKKEKQDAEIGLHERRRDEQHRHLSLVELK